MAENFVTTLSSLKPSTQTAIAANAQANGQTPEEYLISRGGVNPVTGKYGDSYDPAVDLTDAEYLAAIQGKTGAAAGAALNAAREAKRLANQPKQTLTTNIPDTPLATTSNTTDTSTTSTERANTIAILQDRFNKYGLTTLASKIRELAIDGATEATITLQLQDTPEYQTRFAANSARIKKGLTVLSPAEYLNAEDEYRQKLRDYGLKQFDNDAYVKQFIANDTSLTEISNRIVTAVQRVQNADPAVMKQLRDYYGITQESLVGYVLDPEQQFEKIKLQVSASEIGVEANKQGLVSNVAVSEQLAKQGITQAEAQKGYSTIADILPTAEKLSAIYGGTLDSYGQSEGEQEVFNSLASAQRKRQKLSAAEIAQFSGSSGMSKASLLEESKGQF